MAASDGVVVVHAERDGLGRAGTAIVWKAPPASLIKASMVPPLAVYSPTTSAALLMPKAIQMIAAAGSALAADGHDR
jgi:hypothetical protein